MAQKDLYKQSKNWCFTDFQFLEFEKIYNEYKDIIRYICFGKEICPKTNRPHLQGWLQFNFKKRRNEVKKIVGCKKLSLRACKGNEYDNDRYCKKDNDFWSAGRFITQGYRTDLESALKIIRDDGHLTELEEVVPNLILRYSHGLKELIKINQKKKSKKFRNVNTTLHYGTTNTGKTKKATEKPDTFLINGDQLDWFDGYEGESILVIDEYNNDVNITKMLKLLDGYQLRLNVKGSFTYARWTEIHITTNLTPDEIHSNAKPEHIKAFWRRINKKIKYTKLCAKAT